MEATGRPKIDYYALNEDRALAHVRDKAARRELPPFARVYHELRGPLAPVAAPEDVEVYRPDRQRAYAGQG